MYHTKDGGHEFVEIENLTSTPFDIALWRLSGGVDFEFPDFSTASPRNTFLKAFEKILICDTDPGTFRAAYGLPSAVRVFGPWEGNLNNGGERINHKDKYGINRCTVRYDNQGNWPVAADGGGHSLVLFDNNRAIDDYRLWKASSTINGTPGSSEPAAAEEPFANPEVDLSVGIPYIEYTDAWDFNDQNVNLGTSWKNSNYNYSHPGWTRANAANNRGGLYGFETSALPAPGLRTPLLDSSTNANHISYYFRKEFNFSGSTSGVSLTVDLINDGRALQREGALMAAARTGLPVCLMHMQNQPQNMQKHPKYTNIEEEILEFLINRKKACVEASISPEKILFDPGFGFGKNLQHNLQLFRALPKFISTGQPILIGISRKTMVGEITKVKIPSNRTIGSVAFALLAAQCGVAFLRVHDILETKQALLVLESIGLDKDNQ